MGLLQHLIVQVSSKLAQQIRLEDAERLKVWKKKMDDSWSKERGAVYRWIKGGRMQQ